MSTRMASVQQATPARREARARAREPASMHAATPPMSAHARATPALGAPRGAAGSAATVQSLLRLQRGYGNRRTARALAAQRGRQVVEQRIAGADAQTLVVQRDISLSDVIPDAVLKPIKRLVGEAGDYASGVTKRSEGATTTTQTDADAIATQAGIESGATVEATQSQGGAATAQAQGQVAGAEAAAQATQTAGEAQAGQMHSALPAAEYASDPVLPAVKPPPAGTLPGAGPPAAAHSAETWNCDEASVLNRVSAVGHDVLQRLTRGVKALVPEQVLQFAQQGIGKLQSVLGGIKQKVEAARQAVGQWIDTKTKPLRDMVQKAETVVREKLDEARKVASDKVTQLTTWAAQKWSGLKNKVTSAVNGAIEWARSGANGLLDKAKALAGRMWDALPDVIKGPLKGAAAAVTEPIARASRLLDSATAWVEKKAAAVKQTLVGVADGATRWFAAKYQSARAFVVRAGDSLGKGLAWVKKKAGDAGKAVYAGIDKLSGGRVSKWRAAAAARLAELKGDVCAVTGAVAGPCVERFVPDPVGADGKSFASLATKADITVPIEGVPVKVAAGAKITIERTAKKYRLILSGEGFAGVAVSLSGGGGGGGGAGGGGASGSVTVDGTLSKRVLALVALGGQAPGTPGVPIPIGGAKPGPVANAPSGTPSVATTPVAATPGATPAAAPGTTPGAAPGGAKASAEAGKKVSVSLTYGFDATADKTTCDGLGGLTALLASQGAAGLLPAPFSHLAAAGGQAAFADKLISAKVTLADTGAIAVQAGQGTKGSAGAKMESGVSLESRNDESGKSLTATLFQSLSGDIAVNFVPDGVGLSKVGAGLGGRQELAIVYRLAQDKVDASLKQSLTGSVTLGVFAGISASLPALVRERVQRFLSCLPGANEAVVSFELSNNVANLAALAQALDGELNKGEGATAAGVWDVVSTFLKNKDNCYIEFGARLTLTEKVLGVKVTGSADQASGSAELTVSRGEEIVLCPPTRLQVAGGAPAVAASGAAPGATPAQGVNCEEDELIRRFGNRRRDLNIDPDTDPTAFLRPDDAPILESFRRIYNRLDSWNIYLSTNHPELFPEFETTFDVKRKRKDWIDDLKARAVQYKEEFRNLSNTDPERARREYEAHVLGNIEKEIDACNRAIAVWYRDKTGSAESIENIIEDVHGQGTELWRAAWRKAIVQVNGVLAALWPPAKASIVQWVAQERVRLPHIDMSGPVGELDYIGSLATGYKGPPKQLIRFNPEKFDVDANLAAPPLANYALATKAGLSPNRRRIFGKDAGIAPLSEFTARAQTELVAKAEGYNPDPADPFDVAIDAPELPVQQRGRVATERLYKLRAALDTATYARMLDELADGGYLNAARSAVIPTLTESQATAMNAIMDKYERGA